MIVLTAHQPQYLPGLRLFAKIAQADTFVVFDAAQYERKSFENRNYIKTQNGALMLTVPVASQDHFNKTGGEIQIIQNGWARKHCRSIELAYQKAPFYKDYIGPLEAIIMGGHARLADLNRVLLDFMLKAFGISVPVETASNYDFRGEKSGLVLDMCNQLGAKKYLFGVMGEDYADKEAFAAAGIEIEFQDYTYPAYPQQWKGFLPNMSAIDLLMNCGPDSQTILLSGNERA